MSITEHVQSSLIETSSRIDAGTSFAIKDKDYDAFLKSLKLYSEFSRKMLDAYQYKGFRNQIFAPDSDDERKVNEEVCEAIISCPLPKNMYIEQENIFLYGGYGQMGSFFLPLVHVYPADFHLEEFLKKNGKQYELTTKTNKLFEYDEKYIYTNKNNVGHPLFTRWTKFPKEW